MIVVLTGTNPYSFDRLVKPVDKMAKEEGWDVFVQLGNTKFVPAFCKYKRFVERTKLQEMIKNSEFVITQGGYGGIRDALHFNKAIIAVPRKPVLRESTDYQEEIVRAMENQGYLIGLYDIDRLEEVVRVARGFTPKERKSSDIPRMIGEYLSSRQILPQ